MQWNEPKGDEERRMGRFVCAFTDEGRRDEGINSVVRISLRDMLSPFFSFAEAIISRGLPSPVERRAARCMRAIRGEKKKKKRKREPRICVSYIFDGSLATACCCARIRIYASLFLLFFFFSSAQYTWD